MNNVVDLRTLEASALSELLSANVHIQCDNACSELIELFFARKLRLPQVLVPISAVATFGTIESQEVPLSANLQEYDEQTWIRKPQPDSCLLRALASAKMVKSFKAALSERHPWSKRVRNLTLRGILHYYNVPGAGTGEFALNSSVDEIIDSMYEEIVNSPADYEMAVELMVPSDVYTPAADVCLPDPVLESMSLRDYHRGLVAAGIYQRISRDLFAPGGRGYKAIHERYARGKACIGKRAGVAW